ncbi:MAG: acetoin utilization protein AcuB [Desulfobulbus propionicus]|nr:MAG: acetoin utilization protein AcuB [Desulfobulbus propionicus]
MYIGRIMNTSLITVSPETSLVEARKLVEEKGIDHLLVVEGERLVGILSDRDLKQYWASPATSLSQHELTYLLNKVVMKMVMVKTVVTVSPDTTIERAAYTMTENDINALPVVENERLVGIITSTDVIGVLLDAIGISEDGSRLSVFVHDSCGVLAKITDLLGRENINIMSIISWPEKEHPGIQQLVMRVPMQEKDQAVATLEAGGFKVKSAYASDITPFLP